MSQNTKIFTNYDRAERDQLGRTIHVYRQRTIYLTKEEAAAARLHKENLGKSNLNVQII